ncbi:hypothetical protein CXB51_016808 [Gossypium anomalum]|uniref:RNase H type-1 domain-containing protein n=1 Tax=Gossypium anomalum TaxID=47600 RepID=A0A8J5YWX9_9ROSI|nr:hypothetical protein CXB51_016808 [Gossypium anomalum]
MGQISRNANDVVEVSWQPPPGDIIKINFDTSFNQGTGKSVSRILARNREGLIMAACTFPWENILDSMMAEAMACLQVVTMAEEMRFQDIIVEGDALTIIRKLNSDENDKSSISSLIKEIKERGHRFRKLRFEYVPRGANKVAMEWHWKEDNTKTPNTGLRKLRMWWLD